MTIAQFDRPGIWKKDLILVLAFSILTVALYWLPTGYENRVDDKAVRCRGKVVSVDDSEVELYGMVKTGDQSLTLELLDGPFKGWSVEANNPLLGIMARDKIFEPGDTALVVLSLDKSGEIFSATPQDHYRLDLELLLLGLFTLLLLVFGGFTGAKALLSFIFTGMALWKLLVPMLLDGYDPIALTLGLTALLTAAIIFLVAGPNRMGLTAFLGAFLGVLVSCGLAWRFTSAFHVNGAVLPFSETMLYSGYGHLNLTRIYIAAVFLAASGAVMDLAMDVAASMSELKSKRPEISRVELMKSGLRVGRAVVGTMTTTLLLAYSGGYVTLLMAFMAQGVPLANLFNLVYVAAEVLKTLVGSFGLVTVAPFTAVAGALILGGHGPKPSAEPAGEASEA